MAFSCACQCFFTLLLLVIAASPMQTHARESKFFSKVPRVEPEPKPESKTQNISPSPLPAAEAVTEKGYGLFGNEETYEYPPTTKNPTKPEPEKLKYVQPNWVKDSNKGYRYAAGERQGMSDTRFLENGRYFYDVKSEKEFVANNGKLTEDNDGHESYYGHGSEDGNRYKEERYETGERQGMSDTTSLENGRYFHDLGSEQKSRDGYSLENDENYENEEEEEEDDRFGNQAYGAGVKQGMSDTRYLENGRYFYDVKGEMSVEDFNGVESYNREKMNEYYEPEKMSYDSGNQNGKFGKAYDFRSTPNKFPKHEFDSMEEYDKYEQGRSHQEYFPRN